MTEKISMVGELKCPHCKKAFDIMIEQVVRMGDTTRKGDFNAENSR